MSDERAADNKPSDRVAKRRAAKGACANYERARARRRQARRIERTRQRRRQQRPSLSGKRRRFACAWRRERIRDHTLATRRAVKSDAAAAAANVRDAYELTFACVCFRPPQRRSPARSERARISGRSGGPASKRADE